LRLAGALPRTAIYGFGAAAHIVAQVLRFENRPFYALTRPGDTDGQNFARSLGAEWAGGIEQTPPLPFDCALIFAPDGALVPHALCHLNKGGRVICAGIHMSDIPGFPYAVLWGERSISSVANLTRRDGIDFLALAPRIPIRTTVQRYPLSSANEALTHLRNGRLRGAAVLVMDE